MHQLIGTIGVRQGEEGSKPVGDAGGVLGAADIPQLLVSPFGD